MTTLGTILAKLEDRAQLYEVLMESGELPLIAKLDEMAGSAQSDPCEFTLGAVRHFIGLAEDEAWARLIGRTQNSPSPAAACLSEMIAWSLALDLAISASDA